MNNTKTYNLLHITDIHLNFCDEKVIKNFCKNIIEKNPNGLVITGDISESQNLLLHLGFLASELHKKFPIFFVLGNHDFYNGSITEVKGTIKTLFSYTEEMKKEKAPRLAWLGSSGVVPLTKNTAIVGDDGWYDGQYANWFKSTIMLNDYLCITELNKKSCPVRNLLFQKINELSKDSTEYIRINLLEAIKDFDNVFIATHVPPFRESATYRGKMSDANWMPHFSSKSMGDMLYIIADNNPRKNFTVLCGHTHGSSDIKILPNLHVVTGAADYGNPKLGNMFKLL